MRFTKMHGLGNDYVYVNCFEERVADPPGLARTVSDRHLGIGGDGLILICPSRKADVRMEMYNADGSRAQMCGNGIRCVAKYAIDHGLSRARPLRIETDAGVLRIDYTLDGEGKLALATVDMGEPILQPERIPVRLPGAPGLGRIVDLPLDGYLPADLSGRWMKDCGLDPRMTCVSMGNPHLVLYCRQVEAVPLSVVGPIFERLPIFPQRINVHFVRADAPDRATMRTWERGSGITQACGTGASAVCVAGVLTGRTARQATIRLPGGELSLEWREGDNRVYMTGPATEVFSGDWPTSSQAIR